MSFKKILLTSGKAFLVLIGLLVVYLSFAYVLSMITVQKEAGSKEEIPIYILTNGVHTDIVVPTQTAQMDWSREIKYVNTLSKDTTYPYLAMGWGDKGFYLETPEWKDLKASVALKAAFAMSHTAIHATYYKEMTESETCKKIMISAVQYERLVSYLSGSFRNDPDGHAILINTTACYGRSDAFYEANGSYHLFRTCNTWANSALKACGQTCCLWTPFDKGIFMKYQ